MALPIRVNFENPFIDIHTGRGQGSCTFANGFDCICSCAGIAHAQLLRMVLTPENSKKLPDKYKKALADKSKLSKPILSIFHTIKQRQSSMRRDNLSACSFFARI